MLYNEKVLAKRVGTRTAFAVNFTRTESVYQMIKMIAIRRKESNMKKIRIFAFVMLVIMCITLTVAACAGTSLPPSSKKKTGSYSGTFNSLGETPLYYSNYNVKPTSSSMSMWVTGKMNKAGATFDFRSGNGLMGSSSELGSTKLYNFSDAQSSRNNNYSNSVSTSNYYWASFRLIDRNMYAQLVGSYTFKSN